MEEKKTGLSKFFRMVDTLENVVLAITVVGMIVTILLQIIGRVIGRPFAWTEESSRYLFLWMMFIALAAGFNKAESSRVTLFLTLGPKWLKKFSEILYGVIVLAFFGFMVIYGSQVVQQQIMMGEMGTALQIPMYVIGVCVPVSGVLGILGVINSFLQYRGNIAIPDKQNPNEQSADEEKGC